MMAHRDEVNDDASLVLRNRVDLDPRERDAVPYKDGVNPLLCLRSEPDARSTLVTNKR